MWELLQVGQRLGDVKRLRFLNSYSQFRHLAGVVLNVPFRAWIDRLTCGK